MSEKKTSTKALATHVAQVTAEFDAIATAEGSILGHARRAGEAIEAAIVEAGYKATHGRLEEWYKETWPDLSIRCLQNYRSIAREWQTIEAAGAETVGTALKALANARKAKKVAKDGGESTKRTRTSKALKAFAQVSLGAAIDVLTLRLADLASATPEDRAALIGRLVGVQEEIARTITGLVGGKAVA